MVGRKLGPAGMPRALPAQPSSSHGLNHPRFMDLAAKFNLHEEENVISFSYIWLSFFTVRLKNSSLSRFHVKLLQGVIPSAQSFLVSPRPSRRERC